MINVFEAENQYNFFLQMGELKIMGFGYCESLELVPIPAHPTPTSLHLSRLRLLDWSAGIYFNVIMCDLMHSFLLGESSEIIRQPFRSRMQNTSEVN